MRATIELRWRTPDAWAPAALADVRALLSDHAHCELGAAAAAQGFVARAVTDRALIERMAALAIEELRHFRRVHRLLCELGGALEPVRKNPYVEGLTRAARQGGAGVLGPCDRLLVAALVEERSRERFALLAGHAAGRVAELYAALGPSEAGHAALFLELASARCGAPLVAERLDTLAGAEAALVRALPFTARIHSGPPVESALAAVEESPVRRPAGVPWP